jgi:hypothetical protein
VMFGIDWKMNEDADEVGSLDLLGVVVARYLPLGYLCVVFASIADAVLAMRQSTKYNARRSGGCMPC